MRKKLIVSIFILIFILSLISAPMGSEGAENGNIWTTREDCGDEAQNVNHYEIGEKVFIKGHNFDEGEYDWNIMGLGQSENSQASCESDVIVESGSYVVDATGDFCFEAYVVQANDCGGYQVDFNHKHDTYHVVPEFGFLVGVLTILSAVGVFFAIRRE